MNLWRGVLAKSDYAADCAGAGVEATLEAHVTGTFRLPLPGVRNPDPGEGFLELFVEADELPGWVTEEDVATFAAQSSASGFIGGPN